MKTTFSALWLAYLTVMLALGPVAVAQPLAPAGKRPGTAKGGAAARPAPSAKPAVVPVGKPIAATAKSAAVVAKSTVAVPPGAKSAVSVAKTAAFDSKSGPFAPGRPSFRRAPEAVSGSVLTPAPVAVTTGTTDSAADTKNPAVVDLPGEKLFNSCMKMPRGKRVVKLNLKPDTEILDLIGWISSITCTQFLMGGNLGLAGKKVTIIAPQLITPEEAYALFLAALESSQLTVEPVGKFLRIVATTAARYTNLRFYKPGEHAPSDKSYITRMIRLEHLDPTDFVANVLNRIKGDAGDIVTYQNAIIVTDQAVMIDRLMEVIKELDTPPAGLEKIWMLRVKNTSPTDMAARLSEIFRIEQVGTGGRRGANGAPVASVAAPPLAVKPGGNKPVGKDLDSQMTIHKLIPDERSNHLIVVANETAYEWLLTMVRKLDTPVDGGGDARVHVYYCEHANCDELAQTLSAVAGVQVAGGSASARRSRAGAAPAPVPIASPNQAGQQQQIPLFEGEVRVTYDGPTNALIAVSSLKDFQSLRKVIERLDSPRKQVYVEALILEVLLDKSRKMGTGYHAGLPVSAGGKDSLLIGGFNSGKTLRPAALLADPALAGLAGALFGPAINATQTRIFGVSQEIPSFGAFLYFLQENNDVNVLSNPHLLITNNQEGEISVGETLPFPGSFLGGGLGGLGGLAGGAAGGLGFGTSVQRQNVALTMKLIPSVNEHNMIRLDVDQTIEDVSSPNFNGLGPATSKRTAKTQIICKDQQTVVIGGLMKDQASEVTSKVPILGDIPIIGFFFRNTQKTIKKSNIIIALTPYVISDMSDLRRVAEKKMRERREFLERFSSLEDNATIEASVDYRRKRGMLEEINRFAKENEEEENELIKIRERDLQDESTPIERPSKKGKGPPGPGAEPPTPPPSENQARPLTP